MTIPLRTALVLGCTGLLTLAAGCSETPTGPQALATPSGAFDCSVVSAQAYWHGTPLGG